MFVNNVTPIREVTNMRQHTTVSIVCLLALLILPVGATSAQVSPPHGSLPLYSATISGCRPILFRSGDGILAFIALDCTDCVDCTANSDPVGNGCTATLECHSAPLPGQMPCSGDNLCGSTACACYNDDTHFNCACMCGGNGNCSASWVDNRRWYHTRTMKCPGQF